MEVHYRNSFRTHTRKEGPLMLTSLFIHAFMHSFEYLSMMVQRTECPLKSKRPPGRRGANHQGSSRQLRQRRKCRLRTVHTSPCPGKRVTLAIPVSIPVPLWHSALPCVHCHVSVPSQSDIGYKKLEKHLRAKAFCLPCQEKNLVRLVPDQPTGPGKMTHDRTKLAPAGPLCEWDQLKST